MTLEHNSKHKNILLIIFGLLILAGIIYFTRYKKANAPEQVFCTQDVKLCPDGSYVGRVPPDCEFTECPQGQSNGSPFGFGNDQIEKAITNYLLTQKHFSWKTQDASFNFCAIENLKPKNEMFPLYIWAYCGEYILQDGKLKTLSGSSGPVKINYPNELSFYDLGKFSYEAPQDGSRYAQDIRKIFPEDAREKIFNYDRKNIIKKAEDIALANISAWKLIIQAVNNCEAKEAFQAHSKDVTLELKTGEKLTAPEPHIDDIIKIIDEAEAKCGRIPIGTE